MPLSLVEQVEPINQWNRERLEIDPCRSVSKEWNILINVPGNKFKQTKWNWVTTSQCTQKSILVQLKTSNKNNIIKCIEDNTEIQRNERPFF